MVEEERKEGREEMNGGEGRGREERGGEGSTSNR